MGLIKAVINTVGSTVADTFEDYIYCDSMEAGVLLQRGYPRSSGGAGKHASDCVISDGSRIAVNDGQFLIVVENGKIVDFTAEQGGYIFHTDTEPSLFCGSFGEQLLKSFSLLGERFAFGGRASNDQRAYFINTKEILGNRFGFGNIPFRDSEFNMTVLLQGFGVYSYRITDPLVFYTSVCGNAADSYCHGDMEAQLKGELSGSLLPALGRLAAEKICYDRLTLETEKLAEILDDELTAQWRGARGISICAVAFSSILPDDESVDKIRQLQESRVYSADRAMLGARVGAAQANAMEIAADNPAGSVNGFVGMGMVQNAGGVNVNEMMKQPEPPAQPVSAPAQPVLAPAPDASEGQWVCSCGAVNDDVFCPECGERRDAPKTYACPDCGRVISGRTSPPKFCPKCGRKF